MEIQAKRGVAEMARGGDMKEGKARAEEWQRWRDPDAGGMRRQRSGRDAAGVIGKRQQWSSEFSYEFTITNATNLQKSIYSKQNMTIFSARQQPLSRSRLDVYGVLDDGLAGVGAGVHGARLDVAASHAELARAPEDAHLPHRRKHLVAAVDGQAAALVLPGGEHEVHVHEEPEGGLVGERVGPLRAAHLVLGFGGSRDGGAGGERVVYGHHRAEEGGGAVGGCRLRNPDRRRALPR